MVPAAIPPLAWCALWAAPTAVLASRCLPAAAVLAACGWLVALRGAGRCRRAGLAALPACLAALPLPAPPLPPLPLGPVALAGTVAAVVRVPEHGVVLVWFGTGRARLRLSCDGDLEVLPGDALRVLAHVAPAAAPDLPPPVRAIAGTAVVQPGPWSLRRLAAAARRALERQLLQRLPGEPGAMLATLVLGRDTRPTGDVLQSHQATGLSHLLAVSGAHAAMLAFLLGLAGGGRGRRLAAGGRRTVAILLLLFAYAGVTGNEPPVLRAVVAFALAALAARMGRPFGLAPALLAPGLLTCLLQPDALLGPSFLLSYAAVVGLWLAGPAPARGAAARWLWAPLCASAWATLLTAPLTLWFFGQVAPWTVLLTPLLAPVVAALLLGGLMLAAGGHVLPALADLLAAPLAAMAEAYAAMVQAADHLPGTPVRAACAPDGAAMALAGLGAAVLVLLRPARRTIAAAAALLAAPHFLPPPRAAIPQLRLFAVGHGQACLVTGDAGHRAAIDCGSLQQPFVAADRLVAALPVRALDLLVVTHADQDHHNGVPALLTRVAVAAAVLPAALAASPLAAALRAHGAAVRVLAPGDRLQAATHLLVAAPWLPPGASDNDQSLWVQVGVGDATALLCGDAQELGVAAAIAAGLATPHDVLVLPHHGRANANAPALLQRVRPRACFASAAGADGETPLGAIARAAGAELWVTGQHGELRLQGQPPGVLGGTGVRPLWLPGRQRRPP